MEFQPEKESWQTYAERLDHFFYATNVIEDDQKVTALIVANDPSFYTLLKELSFPINPKTMTFYEVMETLKRHYVGMKNIFRERKLFYSAVFKSNESASEWYRRLKSLAINCEFGVLLEEVLVDKFVCGFEGKTLLSFYEQDESLDLEKAFKIAQLHETALEIDNESIEEEESDLSEGQDDQESENEDQDYDHSSTLESQEIDTRQQDEPVQGLMQSQELLELQQQICFQRYLLNDMFLSQSQQQRRIRQPKVHGEARQKLGSHKKQEPLRQQKPPQPYKQQKPIQKQNNQQHQPNQQQVKSQHQLSNHKPTTSQKPPIPQKHSKPQPLQKSTTQPIQKQNNQQYQPNQQQVKSQHQLSNHKPTSSQKPPIPQKQLKSQPTRNQQISQPVQKSTNHQQKPQQQKSQTIQKSTTIITKTKTTIKTAVSTGTNPKRVAVKCHKCGKVGHNANLCNSK